MTTPEGPHENGFRKATENTFLLTDDQIVEAGYTLDEIRRANSYGVGLTGEISTDSNGEACVDSVGIFFQPGTTGGTLLKSIEGLDQETKSLITDAFFADARSGLSDRQMFTNWYELFTDQPLAICRDQQEAYPIPFGYDGDGFLD